MISGSLYLIYWISLKLKTKPAPNNLQVQPFFHFPSLRSRRFGWLKQARVTIKIPIKKQPFKKERLNSNKTKQEKKLTTKHYFNDVAGKTNFLIIQHTKKLIFPMFGLSWGLQGNVIIIGAFGISS